MKIVKISHSSWWPAEKFPSRLIARKIFINSFTLSFFARFLISGVPRKAPENQVTQSTNTKNINENKKKNYESHSVANIKHKRRFNRAWKFRFSFTDRWASSVCLCVCGKDERKKVARTMAQVQQRKLVHKQFNSPIALYSDENVQDKLNKELKLLSNGAVGWVSNSLMMSAINFPLPILLSALFYHPQIFALLFFAYRARTGRALCQLKCDI